LANGEKKEKPATRDPTYTYILDIARNLFFILLSSLMLSRHSEIMIKNERAWNILSHRLTPNLLASF